MRRVTEGCEEHWRRRAGGGLWEDWAVARIFSEGEPLFLVDGEDVLPLERNDEVGAFTFYGGSYLEDRRFWFPMGRAKEFLDAAPRPLRLWDVNGAAADALVAALPELAAFAEEDHRYVLTPSSFGGSFDGFLATFSSKHRKNLLSDLKRFAARGIPEEWSAEDRVDALAAFNVARFGADSDFADPAFVARFRAFLDLLRSRGELHVLTFADGAVRGVGLAAYHGGSYYVLSYAYDGEYPNCGKALIAAHLRRALGLGAARIDFLVGDTGWKRLWNIPSERVVTFRLP